MKQNRMFRKIYLFAGLFVLLNAACSKIEYTQMESPAYLRVFNNMIYAKDMGTRDNLYPMFTMLIEPQFDAQGKIIEAETIGDFLDMRDPYAPPYPSHIGNSLNPYNPEYPGKESVLVAPIVNGFDLSSWAQVPSGKKRVLFVYRPKTEVPFFQLEERLRSTVFADETLDLQQGEVYTLHLLLKDFLSKETGLLLRQEDFHKKNLADSLSYVNFYNMSAQHYANSPLESKFHYQGDGFFRYGIRDTMAVHLSLLQTNEKGQTQGIAKFDRTYLTTLVRNTESRQVSNYHAFPTFPKHGIDSIYSNTWQRIDFRHPTMQWLAVPVDLVDPEAYYSEYPAFGNGGYYAFMACYKDGRTALPRDANYGKEFPNLLVNTHSGTHNPRTFSTVNTVEIVNNRAFLTTVQRVYAPPIYQRK